MLICGICVDDSTYLQVVERCKNFKQENAWNKKQSLIGDWVLLKVVKIYCLLFLKQRF